MGFSDLLSSLGDRFSQNLQDSDDETKAAMKASLQRLAQNGSVADSSPEEDKYYHDLAGAVAGSVEPVAAETGEAKTASGLLPKLRSMFGQGEQMSGAQLMNSAQDIGELGNQNVTQDMINAAQQKASRDIDFKQRLADQLAKRRGLK